MAEAGTIVDIEVPLLLPASACTGLATALAAGGLTVDSGLTRALKMLEANIIAPFYRTRFVYAA